MSDDPGNLIRAAKQLIETERLFGADFLPARRNPLPEEASQQGAMSAVGMRNGEEHADEGGAAPRMTPQQKAAALNELDASEVRPCSRCGLRAGCGQTVFGEGNPDAALVFVGEGPGAEEDRQGRPFVGQAGELLTKMIAAMGLRRQDVYICNIVKCRPPGNRTPMPDEVAACIGHLIRQLEIIRPKVIVAFGNPATQNLLNTKVGITRLRGLWQKLPILGEGLGGTPVMPTFHPAFLLRQYTQDHRQKVWDDLQKVMDLLGLKKRR
jgi:DNA polymerase